jgi:transcriptional regulator GlxA family with amidase domain
MLNETQQLAQDRIAERIRTREEHDRTTVRQERGGRRHRIAAALHRLADRVEPPAPRRSIVLSASGR